jgi:alanyl-tRNA synthetase
MILEISDMMTIKDAQVKEKVYKLYEENKSNIKIINDLISQLLSYEAEKLLEDAMKVDNVTIVKKIFRNREFSEVKKLVSLLTEWDNVIILVSSINAKASLIFACSDNLNYDMKTLLERTCSLIDGGGGGRRKLAQGGGSAENIEQAIEFAAQEVSKRLS